MRPTSVDGINRHKILNSFRPLMWACSLSGDMERVASKSRAIEDVDARSVIAMCLRQNGFSYSTIGYILNRDHASIIYLLNHRQHPDRIAACKRAARQFNNPSISAAVKQAMVDYHKERIEYHQEQINNIKI